MAKTRKVMELDVEGVNLECILMYGKENPYRLYQITVDATGRHRKQIVACEKFVSVIQYLDCKWGFDFGEPWDPYRPYRNSF